MVLLDASGTISVWKVPRQLCSRKTSSLGPPRSDIAPLASYSYSQNIASLSRVFWQETDTLPLRFDVLRFLKRTTIGDAYESKFDIFYLEEKGPKHDPSIPDYSIGLICSKDLPQAPRDAYFKAVYPVPDGYLMRWSEFLLGDYQQCLGSLIDCSDVTRPVVSPNFVHFPAALEIRSIMKFAFDPFSGRGCALLNVVPERVLLMDFLRSPQESMSLSRYFEICAELKVPLMLSAIDLNRLSRVCKNINRMLVVFYSNASWITIHIQMMIASDQLDGRVQTELYQKPSHAST